MSNVKYPIVPTTITVHMGKPDEAVENITVPFIEYIKSVASSELYPTWPTDALKANILAEVSFALNRIYNEWYPSKGYNFDITSTPQYDQTYIDDREIFENISLIVDDVFNDYIRKENQIQPLFAIYCDGKNTTCNGLSQWGSVSLASQGKSPIEILKYYYGNDIEEVFNAPLEAKVESYRGFPLKLGSAGEDVRILKLQLNRISQNYPAIPTEKVTEFFTVDTVNSVKTFQNIFNLEPTGVVDKATWYKIKYIYNSVKKISDLMSEGITIEEATNIYPNELKYGDKASYIRLLKYFLEIVASFNPNVTFILTKGEVFDDATKTMVMSFQKEYNLPVTGVVDKNTWSKLVEVYRGYIDSLPSEYLQYKEIIFPGYFLSEGMSGEYVKYLQQFLYQICVKTKSIPGVRVTGVFDELTKKSVMKIQEMQKLVVNGTVGPITWNEIVELSKK